MFGSIAKRTFTAAIICLIATLCSCRSLTVGETEALDSVYHTANVRNSVDLQRIKILNLSTSRAKAIEDAKLQIAQEIASGEFNLRATRISAESFQLRAESLLAKIGAITIGYNIFFTYYADDYSVIHDDIALLSHEVMHVWQWQNRKLTNYTLARVLWERMTIKNPYWYEIVPGKRFLSYRYEQQGCMVQNYVTQKPFNTPESKVLERLISQALDTEQLMGTVHAIRTKNHITNPTQFFDCRVP